MSGADLPICKGKLVSSEKGINTKLRERSLTKGIHLYDTQEWGQTPVVIKFRAGVACGDRLEEDTREISGVEYLDWGAGHHNSTNLGTVIKLHT